MAIQAQPVNGGDVLNGNDYLYGGKYSYRNFDGESIFKAKNLKKIKRGSKRVRRKDKYFNRHVEKIVTDMNTLFKDVFHNDDGFTRGKNNKYHFHYYHH